MEKFIPVSGKGKKNILFPSSKWKFKSMTMETISGHSQIRERRG